MVIATGFTSVKFYLLLKVPEKYSIGPSLVCDAVKIFCYLIFSILQIYSGSLLMLQAAKVEESSRLPHAAEVSCSHICSCSYLA